MQIQCPLNIDNILAQAGTGRAADRGNVVIEFW